MVAGRRHNHRTKMAIHRGYSSGGSGYDRGSGVMVDGVVVGMVEVGVVGVVVIWVKLVPT